MENLISEIKQLNGLMGAYWLFGKIKTLIPEADFMDMGYNGGYSYVLKDEKLTRYNNKPYDGPEELNALLHPIDDTAFGNIAFELDENYYQVYHNGKEWFLDDLNGYVENFKNATKAYNYIKQLWQTKNNPKNSLALN